MFRTLSLTILGLTILLAVALAAAADSTGLITFRLKDQHDRLHTDARYRQAPLLVLWSDRRGADFMDAWAPLLADSLAAPLTGYRLNLVEVAHGKGAPFFVKGKIKGKFATPGRGPVLMDWDAEFARAYGCAADSCTILLFAPDGGPPARWTVGPVTGTTLGAILAASRR